MIPTTCDCGTVECDCENKQPRTARVMTPAQAYRAALEAAAKVARDYSWVLPMYDDEEGAAIDVHDPLAHDLRARADAADAVCEQIAAAIRALPVPEDTQAERIKELEAEITFLAKV